jgi:hypothetical protein
VSELTATVKRVVTVTVAVTVAVSGRDRCEFWQRIGWDEEHYHLGSRYCSELLGSHPTHSAIQPHTTRPI